MESTRRNFDPGKFESIHQVGGIRTGRLDWPDAGGSPGCRVAQVDTGSGLRFTVAVDRGGDIVEAFYNDTALAYLSPVGYRPPVVPVTEDDHWLAAWPSGLVTACGPRYIGPGRQEDGLALALHGHHSNTPAALTGIGNPDPRADSLEMHLDMTVRDSQFYGPVLEVRRRIACTLGEPVIRVRDQVTNLGNETTAHNWLYHINFGYPLLDRGCRLVYAGKVNGGWVMRADMSFSTEVSELGQLQTMMEVPDPLPAHAAAGSRGLLLDAVADDDGIVHCGVVNPATELGVQVSYPATALPRLANWQHYGPGGSYVTALEPFSGSLLGKDSDDHPLADQRLEPGETRFYELTFTVRSGEREIGELLARQGRLATP